MIDQMNEAKLGLVAVMAALTAFWGWFGWLIVCWVSCMAVDYITGTAVACKNGGWDSSIAVAGLWKKAGSIIAVTVSAGADFLIGQIINNIPQLALPFEYTAFLCPVVVIWYTVTELGSIAENAGKMGAPIPDFLKRIIAIFADKVDAAGNKFADGIEKEENDGTDMGK